MGIPLDADCVFFLFLNGGSSVSVGENTNVVVEFLHSDLRVAGYTHGSDARVHLPHVGWISSHYIDGQLSFFSTVQYLGAQTLTRDDLHLLQPSLDFPFDLRVLTDPRLSLVEGVVDCDREASEAAIQVDQMIQSRYGESDVSDMQLLRSYCRSHGATFSSH